MAEYKRMDSQPECTSTWPVWAALTLLFLIFATITYDHSKLWNNPNRGDQDLDLTLGLKIRHFEALSDGYHHPLLPALIAPFAEKSLAYFAKAKLVNVIIGAAAFWTIAWVGLRCVGPAPTFIALIAISPGLSNKSAELTVEPLLLLLVVLTFYWLMKGFDQPWYWAAAGACGGLGYLTKGSALLLLIAYVACVLRLAPKRVLGWRFLLFPAAFMIIASPLLIYNWQVFGLPIFNYNTAHVIWLDYTEEQMIMFDEGPPTMLTYLATHSLSDMLRRFLKGLVMVRGVEWVTPFLLIFLLVPTSWLAYFTAFPAKQPMIAVATTVVLTFYLPFSWSAVVQRGMRYLLPILPIIFLFLADIMIFYAMSLVHRLWQPPTRQRLAVLAMPAWLTVMAVVWGVELARRDLQAPLAIDFEDQETADLYHLLDAPAFDGTHVLFGPSHAFTGTWLFRHRVAFPVIPPGISTGEFLPWLQHKQIDYILANRQMIKRRMETVREYFAYSITDGVQLLKLAPGWEVIYRGVPPTRFVLIRVR
jgi:hypothetical protein